MLWRQYFYHYQNLNWKRKNTLWNLHPRFRLGSIITDSEIRGGKDNSKDLRHGVAKTMLKLLSGEETISILNQRTSAKDITLIHSNGTVLSGTYVVDLSALHLIAICSWTEHHILQSYLSIFRVILNLFFQLDITICLSNTYLVGSIF